MGEFVEGLGEHRHSVRWKRLRTHAVTRKKTPADTNLICSCRLLHAPTALYVSLSLPLTLLRTPVPMERKKKKNAINPHVRPHHEAATQAKLMLPSSLSSKLEPLAR